MALTPPVCRQCTLCREVRWQSQWHTIWFSRRNEALTISLQTNIHTRAVRGQPFFVGQSTHIVRIVSQ